MSAFLVKKIGFFKVYGGKNSTSVAGGIGFKVLQMWMPAFLVKKKSDFSKYMVCLQVQGEVLMSQCGYFADKGVNFSRFCADIFYGRSLFNSLNSNLEGLFRYFWEIPIRAGMDLLS